MVLVLRHSIQTKYRVKFSKVFQHGFQGDIYNMALRLIAAANGGEDRGIMLGQKESLKVTMSRKFLAVVNPLAGSIDDGLVCLFDFPHRLLLVYH